MKLIIANWKMYLGVKESTHLAEQIRRAVPHPRVRVVICPSAPALFPVGAVLRRSPYHLGAQDVGIDVRGAHTGDVSPRDLRELGATYVIVGHSERRAKGESDVLIGQKLAAALKAGLHPILCVGETRAQRRAGKTNVIIRHQLTAAFKKLPLTTYRLPITIAYEPIWAIGTGASAAPRDVVAAHKAIRAHLGKTKVQIIYGGSVDARTIASFIVLPYVDGVLIGGASAKRSFIDILKKAR